jgi:hypothetical protein
LLRQIDIFLDECGDLGFNETRCSKYLIVGAMATSESELFSRLTKRAHRRFHVKGKGAIEFKFNNSSDYIRRYFLTGVGKTNSRIVWGAINKQQTPHRLRLDKNELYLRLCGMVLVDMDRITPAKCMHIIVDKRSNKRSDRDLFNEYVEALLSENHASYSLRILESLTSIPGRARGFKFMTSLWDRFSRRLRGNVIHTMR